MLCWSLDALHLRYNSGLWLFVQTLGLSASPSERMKPRFVCLAVGFYAALMCAAVVVGVLGGWDVFAPGDPALLALIVGVGAACGTVALGVLVYRLSPALRGLSDELAPQLVDGSRRRDLVLVSVASGVGEEVFFRGALQPGLGLVVTSLLFGVLHVGPDRRYLVWTTWAVAAGFLFGALYAWTGGILAPATAHVLHNASTLLLGRWSRQKRARRGRPGELDGAPPAREAVVREKG